MKRNIIRDDEAVSAAVATVLLCWWRGVNNRPNASLYDTDNRGSLRVLSREMICRPK